MSGPPPQAQIDATLHWVTDRFRDWYAAHPPDLPPRFTRREFGFLWIAQKFFLRHTGFPSQRDFHEFLVQRAPHHAYYSTAYYQTPHASTMKEKGWLGADLIFDLDADHLPNAAQMSFEEQLAEVKVQARKLLKDFLLDDFGFDEQHVRIVFSGGRGYHFHVFDPRVLPLDSAARREIVDYVSPNDVVVGSLFEAWQTTHSGHKDEFGRTVKDKKVQPAHAPGWNGRITRVVCDYLETLLDMPTAEAERELTRFEGIGPTKAREVLEKLTRERIERIRRGGFGLPHPVLQRESVVRALVQHAKIHAPGETDEPVTADVKRLIRLPGSLHGKSGLRVTPLTIDEFERFDPLRDAVAFDDAPVDVVVSKPQEVHLRGRRVKAEAGAQTLPLDVAMFLVLRRSALRPT